MSHGKRALSSNKPVCLAITAAMSLAMLTACQEQDGSAPQDSAEHTTGHADVSLTTLSSLPGQVSGGSVLLGVSGVAEDAVGAMRFIVNGNPVSPERVTASQDTRVDVLLGGLSEGDNRIMLHDDDDNMLAALAVTNHPVTGPMFSGPQQYPFVCSSVLEWGVQPLVDHDEDWGFPVYNDNGELAGYSKDCSVETFVEYHYMNTAGEYQPWPESGERPDDLATTTLTDGSEVDFVVRWERGTINRFLYSFATLADPADDLWSPSADNWNGRLLYHFEGGVGVGHFQGRVNATRARLPEALGRGYAVIYSSGNRTGEHYNLEVGGETAVMVKEHFVKRFGEPLYTVAIGGSGGAIQQYVYSQNHPGLIDAGVPQYSYPDMVTQTIHIGDCELLEHYMDVTDRDNPRWQVTENRTLLVGLAATDNVPDPLADAKRQLGYNTAPGSTECIPGWRGLSPLSMNPHYGQVREQQKMHPPGIMDDVQWTHYDDLRNIYGLDDNGWPRVPWDNVGVQYGLQALLDGEITEEEFLHLNAHIGGWKHPSEFVQEGFPFLGDMTPENFDPWSRRNMNLSDGETPAPRTEGDIVAINNLYNSGMVFDGELSIPIIDWRHYLEHILDMHNTHQSFSVRQRVRNALGHSDHHLVWFTDARPERRYDHTQHALDVLHDWLMNLRENPDLSLSEARPDLAVDACFATDGSVIARGEQVWDGIIDDRQVGPCTEQFPLYSTSRIVAGSPIEGSIFKCALKAVDVALSDGTYGQWQPDDSQIARLNEIFPQGVCDYSQPDQGRP